MPKLTLTLAELLDHPNETIRRNAMSIYKTLQKQSNCQRCKNPLKMYWCNQCETNQDTNGFCDDCGDVVVQDTIYHKTCN